MIGGLSRRIQIQARSTDFDSGSPGYRDAHSGASPLWSTVATVWADVHPATGRDQEYMAAQQITEEVKYVVKYRRLAFPAITEQHRIVFTEDGNNNILRALDIQAVRPDIRRDWMRLDCTEGAAHDMPTTGASLLLESGDFLLLESGDKLLLEA